MTTHSGLNSPIVSSKDETNATMSQRIDLTQFEGIWDKKHLLLTEKTPTDGYHWSVGFENDVEASMSVSSEFGKEIHEEADRFYHAIDKMPDLLAELKRMYEREDFLMKAREIWLIEERRLEKQVEVYRKKMLQSVGRTSDIEKDLRKALRIIRDDLNDALKVYPIINQEDIEKVRNFANDASQ